MLLKNRVMPIPTTKRNEILGTSEQEDAWLNDMGPVVPTEKTHASLPSSPSIASDHRLWPDVLRLSAYIWQELMKKPGISSVTEAVQVEYVQKRTLDILLNDRELAQRVHDLSEAQLMQQSVIDEVCGYGPLTALMRDESVSEITVVGPRFAYIERNGMVEDVPSHFADDQHMLRIIENILRKVGRRMRNDWPIVDIRLPDGSLVNIVMPPSSVNGPTITIRKGSTKPLTMEQLVQMGTLSAEMAEFLQACVQARLNIAVCGGVNAGRTTLLNALAMAIPMEECIATIEDAAELRLSQRHVTAMVAQLNGSVGPSVSGTTGTVTMRDLVRNALHTGAERIVLGECQGDEAAEMLKAMYNGYNGSLMSLYATNIPDCLTRLEAMWLASGDTTPLSLIRHQMATALDVIVYISRLRNGARKILNIAEVQSTGNIQNDAVKWQSIFYYKATPGQSVGEEAHNGFVASGFHPTFLTRIEEADIVLPKQMFIS